MSTRTRATVLTPNARMDALEERLVETVTLRPPRALRTPTPAGPLIGSTEIVQKFPPPDERGIAARARIIAGQYLALSDDERPSTLEYGDWLIQAVDRLLGIWPMRTPDVQATADIEGHVNVYLRRFSLPHAVYLGPQVKALVTTGALGDAPTALQSRVFHTDDPRLAHLTPAGVILDELRVGPTWDDLLDTWMRRKIARDLVVGAALAAELNVPFAGVRILTCGAWRHARLARVNAAGKLQLRPLGQVDLHQAPARSAAQQRAQQPTSTHPAVAGAGLIPAAAAPDRAFDSQARNLQLDDLAVAQ
jgi:hypothetical protein